MIEIKAYQCEHGCGKYLKTKSSMKKHELKCFHNPIRRACISCDHNEGYNDSDDHHEWSGRWCNELEFDIFTEKYNGKCDCESWTEKKDPS